MTPTTYQIFVWLALFLAFVTFFSILALFTMKLERDSLLYAKFLTVDN